MPARNRVFFPIPTILIFILLFLSTLNHSNGDDSTNPTSPCAPLSCGNVGIIQHPFRLKTEHRSCKKYKIDPYVELDCQNNQTILVTPTLRRYFVHNISYFGLKRKYDNATYRIRVADPGINRENLFSCPLYSVNYNDFGFSMLSGESYMNAQIAFIHCLSPINSIKYIKTPFCGNRSNIFANSSKFYSYLFMVEEFGQLLEDLEESCTVDKVTWVSLQGPMKDTSSLASIYDGLSFGFEVQIRFHNAKVENIGLWREDLDFLIFVVMLLAELSFVIGSLLILIWLEVYIWRRRHSSMDRIIENFLQSQHNLTLIKYTYVEIKKMTNNFTQKLGEGGYGIVYKGKLRSGSYVAIKMTEQSLKTEEEFISELGTIGRIHHVNVVQLIGFCMERSKYALVYEFMANGSLDRYIFNQQSLDVPTLTYKTMFEIALGVAHGIAYLHHGCYMRILHFDIKPHNILLDEKFNPKISDFGLAQLYNIDESFINLTTTRGTVGYMAPEIFYKNFGGLSSKVDVYSFGMMLMEMAGRRKNMNLFLEDANQIYFPSLVYDQLCAGEDIEMKDATEEEKKMVKRIIMVALWCIQMRPSNRPSMHEVVEMLESEYEIRMPPKPFVASHEMATHDNGITRTYSVEYINVDLDIS